MTLLFAFSFCYAFLTIYGVILKLLSLPKNRRLIKNEQFKAVLARRLSVHDRLLSLYVAENECGFARIGVSVGKSCGGAVVRNRLKRLLREAFRQSRHEIPSGFDYLIMISPYWVKNSGQTGVRKLEFEQVKSSVVLLAAKAVAKTMKRESSHEK